jgi:hypothetical protein
MHKVRQDAYIVGNKECKQNSGQKVTRSETFVYLGGTVTLYLTLETVLTANFVKNYKQQADIP